MPHRLFRLSFVSLPLFAAIVSAQDSAPPKTPKIAVEDTHHGVKVVDHFRWLEKTGDANVKEWIAAQNRHSQAYLNKLPARELLRKRLAKLLADPSPSYGVLNHAGGTLFALKRQPPKQQLFLVALASADDPDSARIIVDPNELDPKGLTSIDYYQPSRDGKKVAVALSEGGSEEGTLYIYDAATGKKLTDVLPRVTGPTAGGCVAWSADGEGFFYTRYPRGKERPKEDLNFYVHVYYHWLGEPMEKDTYVLGEGLPRIAEIFLDLSPDGRQLLATFQKGDGGEFEHFVRSSDGKVTRLTNNEDQISAAAFGQGDDEALYLLSRKQAPRGKILRLPLGETDINKATTFLPEGDVAIIGLEWRQSRMVPHMVPTAKGLVVQDVVGGPSQVRVVSPSGKVTRAPLPPVSAVQDLCLAGDEVLLQVTSFTTPATWYAYKPGAASMRPTALSSKTSADYSDIEVTRLSATSKDGTKVPVSVLHKKGLKLDGNNPTLLYAYGGYGTILSPTLSPSRRVWLDHGGVYAVANIRGGGEYGEPWHKAAVLDKRQIAYDDFLACAQHLIDKGYTNPKKLAIQGGSNGGLLMGVALTQRPDLFRAVIAQVGIFDMLRVELHPNGAFNVPEFGTVKNPQHFKALYAYSPLHNVKDGVAYPAVLFTTGANDGRVDPSNSYKMTARLQEAAKPGQPILLRVSFDAGHGIGSGLDHVIEQTADLYAFLFDRLGMEAQK
ncbi:MAG: prolyl oligopeptidase family serine peptidase [Gemmataceae bacterium]|nr:prolyl oligopeptidase family serine peptidase [Gemmataceae bacterium]MCI0738439.1 prolyl oligopeptidase family serine peptidase [Gemmataceae bacterium]